MKVVSGEGYSPCISSEQQIEYTAGHYVEADSFDPDIRVECTHGIHFFMTKKEAEQW